MTMGDFSHVANMISQRAESYGVPTSNKEGKVTCGWVLGGAGAVFHDLGSMQVSCILWFPNQWSSHVTFLINMAGKPSDHSPHEALASLGKAS